MQWALAAPGKDYPLAVEGDAVVFRGEGEEIAPNTFQFTAPMGSPGALTVEYEAVYGGFARPEPFLISSNPSGRQVQVVCC